MSKKTKIYFLHIYFRDHDLNRKSMAQQVLKPSALDFSMKIHSSRKYKVEMDGIYPFLHAYIQDSGRNTHIIRDIKDEINFIPRDQIKLQDKILYRTPKLDLPTMKVDLIKDKYNVSVKRDKSKADYVVTSHKFIESLFEGSWHNAIPSKDLREHIEQNKSSFEEVTYDLLTDFFHVIGDDAHVKLGNSCSYNSIGSALKNKLIPNHNHPLNSGRLYPHYVVNYDELLFLKDKSVNHVLDTDIIAFCNEDSVILKVQEVKSIVGMLKSEDKDNHAIALEMLANCNIEKSFDKIALLFSFYGNTLKYASNWNHVNVKSLRKAMNGIPPIESGHVNAYTFSSLVRVLHKKNKLTPFAVKAIQKKMLSSILNDIGLSHENSVFDLKFSDIKLKEDYPINFSDDLPF